MAAGRPTKYNKDYCEQAKKLCMLGLTDAELGAFFEVDEATINRWKLAHPEFCESLRQGKQIADAEVSAKLYHRATGYSHEAVKIVADAKTGQEHKVPYVEHYPPDTTACIFWLKNRQKDKWRDKVDTELTGANGGPVEFTKIVREIVKPK